MLDNAVRDKVPARLLAEPLKPVLDPAQWTGAELDASDDWKLVLTADDIEELDDAVAGVEARGLQIKDITLANFPLPQLDATLARLRHQLMEGRCAACRSNAIPLNNRRSPIGKLVCASASRSRKIKMGPCLDTSTIYSVRHGTATHPTAPITPAPNSTITPIPAMWSGSYASANPDPAGKAKWSAR